MTSEIADWDPAPEEREYYTHRQTGDFGWLVRRDGEMVIKLDRPGLDELRHFKKADQDEASLWTKKIDVRPLQPAHLAQIAFAADRQLCMCLGLFDQVKLEWIDLSPEKKRAWIEKGPKTNENRRKLYEAIMGAVGHLANG